MYSESVELRHPKPEELEGDGDQTQPIQRRPRPRSASYVALRLAVYQLTSMADFKREKIGSGFFADVYKVQHKTTGEVMVLKMNKSRKNSRSMLSEIQLMNRLSHPNILKFKGSCVHEGHLHALMEYINGGSLEELLMDETVKLPWRVRLKIIRDIVNGMVYLHSKNVFHRDLNPKNCLIQREKDGGLRSVVADFGLAAKIKQRRRRSHTEAVGSPYWMAPEVLKGNSYCEQADVFSFGITLAEIVARISADPDFMPRTQKFGLDVNAIRPMCDGCPEQLFELLDKCCQIDPDDRPNFEEISNFLDSVHLTDDGEEKGGLLTPPPSTSPVESHKDRDLRACISEPFIRLNDDSLPEDDSRSCGSEGESRVIVEHHSRHHRQRLLGSLGSSASSSCGSRGEETDYNGADHLETNTEDDGSDNSNDPVAGTSDPLLDTSDPTDTSDPLVDTTDSLVDTSSDALADTRSDAVEVALEQEEQSCTTSRNTLTNGKSLLRRSSDGTLSLPASGDDHRALQKSKSLNVELENDQFPPQHPITKGFLNSSAQTLVPEDEMVACDNVGDRGGGGMDPVGGSRHGGGGDSGIDPGDIEVFTFPPSTTSLTDLAHYEYTAIATAEELTTCDQGDHTPICTSPNLNSTKYYTPISKGVAINGSHDQTDRSHVQTDRSRDQGVTSKGTYDQDCFTSPVHSRFSFSGTSSDELTDFDGQNFVTPSGQCISPIAGSWTSSECSFSLPTPSTPWAPPSSPLPPLTPHSLPTSPTLYGYAQFSTNKPRHRNSHEITRTSMISCLRKTSHDQPHSCRNSALFPDLTRGEDLSMGEEFKHRLSIKSVHFMDADESEGGMKLYSDVDLGQLPSSTNSWGPGRPRSTSNPHAAGFRKVDSAGFLQRQSNEGEYGIGLRRDWVNTATTTDPHFCKGCYRIAQRSNTRLSSSTPDLSKLVVPIAPSTN